MTPEKYFYSNKLLAGQNLTESDFRRIFEDPDLDLLELAQDAFMLRKKHFGRKVKIHILNNVQNGLCPEDCGYCGQAKTSDSDNAPYALKKPEAILEEARQAKENGAFRYCMVLSGRGPSDRAIDHMCDTIKTVKETTGLKTCLSAGLMTQDQVKKLKQAGLDRLNHNLNTSQNFYPSICSTHSWDDRMDTLKSARDAGLELCSGYIFGMGESLDDRIQMFTTVQQLTPESIPVNFLLPIKGNQVNQPIDLSPETCLKILCAMRFASPKSEVRMAAGREYHLRSLQSLALYPANSLFASGYLLTGGDAPDQTLQMIEDAGFEIECDEPIKTPKKAKNFVPLKSSIT